MNYGGLKTTEKEPHDQGATWRMKILDFLVGVLVHSVDVHDADSVGDLLKRIRGLNTCWSSL